MPDINNEQDKNTFSLLSTPQFTFSKQDSGDTKKKRCFSGIAYSGEEITGHWYWGNLVFDLSTMSVPDKLPALLDHDSSKRCGYVTEHTIDSSTGFSVGGNLLSNQYGTEVSNDSDDGFPWQMSVRIDPGSVEEVKAGNNVVVNNKTFSGPITIFRNSTISEVSFTALGWDTKTSAVALSKKPDQFSKESNMAMTDDERKEMDKLKADLDAANELNRNLTEQFSKQKTDKRLADIAAFCKDTGQEFKADSEETKSFAAMSDTVFESSTALLKAQFSKMKTNTVNNSLFSHTATSGTEQSGTTASQESPLLKNAKQRSK